MDSFAALSAYGLLFVLIAVVAWKFLARGRVHPTSNPSDTLHEYNSTDPVERIERFVDEVGAVRSGSLIFPGQPIIEHAAETIESTFEGIEDFQPYDEQSNFYIFLTALVGEAYRSSFPEDLSVDAENYAIFIHDLFVMAQGHYERRFGPWRPFDDDDPNEDFFEAVTDEQLTVDNVWPDRHRELVGSERKAAELIDGRIISLRG